MNTTGADELLIPRFVERFPEYSDHIIELRFRDSAVNELCHDYDDVVNALAEESAKSGGYPPGGSLDDLRLLKKELERELLQRLSRYQSAKSRK